MRPDGQLSPTPRYREVERQAELIARQHGHTYVGVEHLLLAILHEGHSVAAIALQNAGLVEPVHRELLALMARASEADQNPSQLKD